MSLIKNYLERREEVNNLYQDLLLDIYEDICFYLSIEDDMNYEYIENAFKNLIRDENNDKFLAWLFQVVYIQTTKETYHFKSPQDLFKYTKQYARKNV